MSDSTFIELEYQECYDQLRYYDTREEQLAKYIITLASSVATIQFALLSVFAFQGTGVTFYANLLGSPDGTLFFGAQSFLSFIVFIGSLIILAMMVQNRMYFVFTARQLNAIRKYFLSTQSPSGFSDNQLYTSTDFSAFKLCSVHTVMLFGAVIVSSGFAAITYFGISRALNMDFSSTVFGLVFIIVGIVEAFLGAFYLITKSDKSADSAIHGCSDT